MSASIPWYSRANTREFGIPPFSKPPSTTFTSQAVEYDLDDSQVKTLEWQGRTFYVTAKQNAIATLRNTYSVWSLMEEGQLQQLENHVGDFVNNYTSEVLITGIIRRHSKSALMASMTLTMDANQKLDRFQTLACLKYIVFHMLEQHSACVQNTI